MLFVGNSSSSCSSYDFGLLVDELIIDLILKFDVVDRMFFRRKSGDTLLMA